MKPLTVLFEDNNLAVIEKPIGISVHPGAGTPKGETLVDLLKKQFKTLSTWSGKERAGIVHRLDKNTSGLLIIAKNNKTHEALQEMLKKHTIQKYYTALIIGTLKSKKGTIQSPITRSHANRKKMTAGNLKGKMATTHFTVQEAFHHPQLGAVSLITVQIETGRTHQIRVHFNAIGHPIVGDPTYGRPQLNKKFIQQTHLNRQFLHASKLKFTAPSGKKLSIKSKLPKDLQNTIDILKK